MDVIELLKAVILGIVEGITEWLPISSTGHMILVDEFLQLNMSDAFKEMFLVVIQLGAILAVVVLYWGKLFPFKAVNHRPYIERDTLIMWLKIVVASIPAGVIGLLFEDVFNRYFYNYQSVAIMLILFGILFIVIERWNRQRTPKVNDIAELSYQTAFWIGVFQLIAAIFPGVSRSGATIVGALLLGVSRSAATEFTFFLAVPAMLGASALKLVKFGLQFSGEELIILLTGMVVAFVVSVLAIKFLVGYVKKHDFTAFGWYRIVLGCAVLIYFLCFG